MKITTAEALAAHVNAHQGETIVLLSGRTVYVGQPDRTGGYTWAALGYDEDCGQQYPMQGSGLQNDMMRVLDWLPGHGLTVLSPTEEA